MRFILASIVMLALSALSARADGNVAYKDGNVRFTVITDGVIRLEWHPQGQFTDLASFVASEASVINCTPLPILSF